MFGATLAGRPVKIAEQIDTLKYVLNYDNISSNRVFHLSIFLLPSIPFDLNYTALIYYQFQKANVPVGDFRLLGGLNAGKQSAIFKINPQSHDTNGSQRSHTMAKEGDIDMDTDTEDSSNYVDTTLIIGISIEPNATAIPQLEQMKISQQRVTHALTAPPPSTLSISEIPLTKDQVSSISNKIIKNAYDFLSSFVDDSNKVPIKRFDDWWTKFRSKLSNDPKFLDNLN